MVNNLSSYIFEIKNRDIVTCATENLAVVDDNDCRAIYFKIPAIIDEVDITDKLLAIRYINALGQFDTFFSEQRKIFVEGNEKYILFPWYLSQKATAASGNITYDVSVYDGQITDQATDGQYILHTKPQVLKIEDGLFDVGSASQSPEVWADAIATFEKLIGSYHNEAIDAANNAKQSEINARSSEINAENYKSAASVSANNAAASEVAAKQQADSASSSAANARQSEGAALNSQIAADNSAQAAATSETNAKQSETNAAKSESNAETSAKNAAASQTASATSEANAKKSEANAKASENAAKESATASANSASASANSAQDALDSQNASKTSEANALASEKAAKLSETNAATSESNANDYADNSKQSADDSAASAAAALTSQNAAKASEDKAKTSETNSASSATKAATSESNAKTSETNAAASATKAKASETASANSASAAKTSEINAKTSETNAANILADALKTTGGTMTGNITMSGSAKFVGDLTGNADTATTATNANHATNADSATSATSAGRATNDGNGNNIANTYGKISAVAGYHNSIFRGSDITSKFTDGTLFSAISAGTFDDLYIGDYFTATCNGVSTKWRLAGFDIYYNCGDTALTRHHAVVIPDNILMTSNMNTDHVTTGAYVGSRMYTEVLPGLATQISNMVGSSHLIKYRDLFANATASTASGGYSGWTGASSSWAWYDCTIRLCNEIDVYGTRSFTSSGYDVGMACVQLPLFILSPNLRVEANRNWWWLSAVADSGFFCVVSGDGYADGGWASFVIGVRPRFLIG